jgi:hypothetical protein
MKYRFLLLLVAVLITSNCSKESSDLVLSEKDITDVELKDISSDIEIYPIKSSHPMKKVDYYQSFGNYLFLRSEDSRTIYCVEGDSVISILDKGGRGRGEYNLISSFCYSPNDSLLYVFSDDMSLYTYKGLGFDFIEKAEEMPMLQSMRPLGGGKLFAYTIIGDNDIEDRYSYNIVDTQSGLMSSSILKMNKLGNFAHMKSDFYQNNDSLFFCVHRNGKEELFLYNIEEGKLEEIFEFMYEKKLRIPKRVIIKDSDNHSEVVRFQNYIRDNNFCIGIRYPIVKDNGNYISFWSLSKMGNRIFNIWSNGHIDRYHIRILGIQKDIRPDIVINDNYITIFQDISREIDGDSNKRSDLAEKIFLEFDKNKGNPVILRYKI